MSKPTTRAEALAIIDQLFPADSPLCSVASTGKKLLEQARTDTAQWRESEPDAVIIRYAELCQREEQYQIDLLRRSR